MQYGFRSTHTSPLRLGWNDRFTRTAIGSESGNEPASSAFVKVRATPARVARNFAASAATASRGWPLTFTTGAFRYTHGMWMPSTHFADPLPSAGFAEGNVA